MPRRLFGSEGTRQRNRSEERDERQTATFAAGCFWGVEAAFRELDGVRRRASATPAATPPPRYKQVCRGKTGHAEAVEVSSTPSASATSSCSTCSGTTHNPTTLNRQGSDVGNQYRSAIFFHDEVQQVAALESLEREQSNRRRQIVTQIVPPSEFWKAEDYHQQYLEKRGQASCAVSVG